MFKISNYTLYKYSYQKNKFDLKKKYLNLNCSHIFFNRKNIKKLKELNLAPDKNLIILKKYLNQDIIDCILIIFSKKKIIHSSGLSFKKPSVDKFFYNFQNKKYAVIGPTYTNNLFRGKNYYGYALKLQIKEIIKKHKIKDIYISTEKLNRPLKPFLNNNLEQISLGLIISFFKRFFIYIVYSNFFKLRIYYNNNLLIYLN